MNITLQDLHRFFLDQQPNQMIEVTLTYVGPYGNEQVYTFQNAASPEEMLDKITATVQRYLDGMQDTAERWAAHHGDNWKEEYQASFNYSFDIQLDREWRVRTWEEYCVIEKEHYIKVGRLHACTYEEWWDSFEVLPPLHYERNDAALIESFMMSEYYTSTFTTQYVSCKCPELLQQLNLPIGTHVCASRMIDTTDKATWITYKELAEWALANVEEVREKCQAEIEKAE